MEPLDKKVTKKPTKVEEMTKEQIRQAIIKKRECNAKAQNIVESLLENSVNEDFFLKCLPDINVSHFEDIIEERSILHFCGYPLCEKTLSEKDIPKQKYRISVKTNKVYDITVRKCFCSNICYKSAMYVKKQMLSSPLWFREYEEIPIFHLLPLDSLGSLGQEVDLGLPEKITLTSEKQSFTSINDFTSATLHEMDTFQKTKDSNEASNKNSPELNQKTAKLDSNIVQDNKDSLYKKTQENMHSNFVTPEAEKIQTNVPTKTSNITIEKKEKQVKSNPLNIVGEIVEKPEKTIDPILLNLPSKSTNMENRHIDNTNEKHKPFQKKEPSITAITIEVEKCLAEWFTIDTLLFLFGEEKVKEMVTDKGQCIKKYLHNYSQSIFYNSNTYDQYQALCRKLNMLELEDRKYDAQTLTREMKPLPDYSILKEESKKLQIKVRAFFAGETDIPEINNTETEVTNEEYTTQLPLVDKNAQNALRRRIVCQHLNKALPDLLKSLGLLTLTVSSDIRLLVNTFTLKANNIMFKPIQWMFIAIVFIKLLSIRDKKLEYLLQQPTAFQHMQLLLLSYKQDGGYLERLISWLTDIDRLLGSNDTQLTIE